MLVCFGRKNNDFFLKAAIQFDFAVSDPDWGRTSNLLLRRQLLYPLSYGTMKGVQR